MIKIELFDPQSILKQHYHRIEHYRIFMTFKDLNIIGPILKALNEKGYTTPTPIQQQAIKPVLEGRDILGLAQTGTGKTAAFALPIIQQIYQYNENSSGKQREIQALILTPTRELAIQIDECLAEYTAYTGVRHCVIFGGVKQTSQVNRIKAGIDILVATPGRLLDLMNQKLVSLRNVSHFVLDEADQMLDMGFIHDIKRILPKLPKEKQTLFFSATMPNSIDQLSKSILRRPIRVEVSPASSVVDVISQSLYYAEKDEKAELLIEILQRDPNASALVFTRTKHGADKVARILNKAAIGCAAIHGNKSQNNRQRALENFKEREIRVLVATDIAARGIDISDLELVVNYDLPDVPEVYVHRIGRTGRAGKSGMAVTLCAADEVWLLEDVQRLIGKRIEALNDRPTKIPSQEELRVKARDAMAAKMTRIKQERSNRTSQPKQADKSRTSENSKPKRKAGYRDRKANEERNEGSSTKRRYGTKQVDRRSNNRASKPYRRD